MLANNDRTTLQGLPLSFLWSHHNIVPFHSNQSIEEWEQDHLNIQFKSIHWVGPCKSGHNALLTLLDLRTKCIYVGGPPPTQSTTGQFRAQHNQLLPVNYIWSERPRRRGRNSILGECYVVHSTCSGLAFAVLLATRPFPGSINNIFGTLIYYRRNCIFAGNKLLLNVQLSWRLLDGIENWWGRWVVG